MIKVFRRIETHVNSTKTANEIVEELKTKRHYDYNKEYAIVTTTGRADDETTYYVGVEVEE